MITVDFLISFGYFKKFYFQVKDDLTRRDEIDKDHMNKITDFRVNRGEDRADVRRELSDYNRKVREDAELRARGVIAISAESLTRSGFTEGQARELYRSA